MVQLTRCAFWQESGPSNTQLIGGAKNYFTVLVISLYSMPCLHDLRVLKIVFFSDTIPVLSIAYLDHIA